MLSFEDMSEADTYNAWEEDMATLNIFFGQETVMGDPKDSKKTNPKPNLGQIVPKYLSYIQSRAGEEH